MSNATPKPWRQSGRSHIDGSDRTCVAIVNRPAGGNEAVEQANADLIVRSVNCHAELLAVLNEYGYGYTDDELRQLAQETSGMGEIGPTEAAREIRRRAAIAKATGTPPPPDTQPGDPGDSQ